MIGSKNVILGEYDSFLFFNFSKIFRSDARTVHFESFNPNNDILTCCKRNKIEMSKLKIELFCVRVPMYSNTVVTT